MPNHRTYTLQAAICLLSLMGRAADAGPDSTLSEVQAAQEGSRASQKTLLVGAEGSPGCTGGTVQHLTAQRLMLELAFAFSPTKLDRVMHA